MNLRHASFFVAAPPQTVVDRGRSVARAYLFVAALLLLSALIAGVLVAFHYTSGTGFLNRFGLPLTLLRPLHTGAAIGWIFFAGMAMVYRWLFEHLAARSGGGEKGIDRTAVGVERRAFLQLALWVASAVAAGLAVAYGYSSGREYLEYPPAISIPIAAGWLLYAVNFAVSTRFRLRTLPVFAWMWATSVFLFLWTFAEAHLWLWDLLAARPVRDLAIQWQSYGSLVGSFNLLVYGSLYFLGSRLSGSEAYARSNLAFALFFVGVLNSFTNYGHHTYHLPQSEVVKWIAFVVSMTEAILLVKAVADCAALGRRWSDRGRRPVVTALLVATSVWTAVQIAVAIAYSIPRLNVYVHGTLAIVAHSMGTLIGIDTLALLAVALWLVYEDAGESVALQRTGPTVVVLANLGLAGLWIGLLGVGIPAGLRLVRRGVLPWSGLFPAWLGPVLIVAGLVLATALFYLILPLLYLSRSRGGRRGKSLEVA